MATAFHKSDKYTAEELTDKPTFNDPPGTTSEAGHDHAPAAGHLRSGGCTTALGKGLHPSAARDRFSRDTARLPVGQGHASRQEYESGHPRGRRTDGGEARALADGAKGAGGVGAEAVCEINKQLVGCKSQIDSQATELVTTFLPPLPAAALAGGQRSPPLHSEAPPSQFHILPSPVIETSNTGRQSTI